MLLHAVIANSFKLLDMLVLTALGALCTLFTYDLFCHVRIAYCWLLHPAELGAIQGKHRNVQVVQRRGHEERVAYLANAVFS